MAHFRRHWKKYTFGSVALSLLGRWAWKKNEENNVIRQYCLQAKVYGEETIDMTTRPKKVFVFLNPEANNKNARKRFQKCSAPLLHLSGMDVIVIESNYEGQIQTLLGYIDPTTTAVVVAGGGGTLMEVVNGLLRRSDDDKIDVPIGIVPLGKENNFFKQLYDIKSDKVTTKAICEATMDIIRGLTGPISLIKLEPQKGNTLHAVSSVEWGAIYNAEKNKDSFKLLGRLRTVCSYINTAIRKWPEDFSLNVWQDSRTSLTGNLSLQDTSELKHSSFNPLGFKLLIDRPSLRLSLSIWPLLQEKNAFIRQGWQRTLNKTAPITLEPRQVLTAKEFTLSPAESQQSVQHWYSIDGEPFEAIPLQCSILTNKIRIFTPKELTINETT